MLTLKQSIQLYPDQIRVYATNHSLELHQTLIHQMVTCKPKRSSKCRADFRGVCDPALECLINETFTTAFKAYVDELFDASLLENFDFYQDWSVNVYRNGAAAFNHSHNEAFLTMTYYPQDCEGADQEIFNSALLKLNTGQLVLSNPEGIPIWDRFSKNEARLHFRHLPKAGELVVFPGYMPHWTVPGEQTTRYCLSCFVIAKQKTAKKMEL